MVIKVIGGGYKGYPLIPCLLRIATLGNTVPRLYKKPKINEWYEKKFYPHFDSALPFEDAQRLVTNPQKVISYPFSPLLAYEKKARRFKGHDDRSVKKRPIKYAAHKDGYIYSYYARNLSAQYEERIGNLNLDDNVIAYRKGIGKNNVSFACDAFDEIDARGNCLAMALDISGFFDNINHDKLKDEWCLTIGEEKLPLDQFKIFQSLTKWAEVSRDECYERLNIDTKDAPFPLCNDSDFHKVVKARSSDLNSLVTRNKNNFGVPQGTAMSALLSNIYMIPFDVSMMELSKEIGGYYRRYSDDILWICSKEHEALVLSKVDEALIERGVKKDGKPNLIRKDEKTDISIFENSGDNLTCDKPFQYLGFTYDGNNRLIRSQTLARYWRRLIYSVRAVKREANKARREGKNPKSFRKALNQELTHLGNRNFITAYAYKAQRKMGGRGIRNQVKDHQAKIEEELNMTKAKRKRRRQKSKK